MKLDKQDWKKLQLPLAALGAVIVVVALLFGWAEYYNASQVQALQKQQILLGAARQRYQSSGSEKDMITEYLPQYQELINKGFVGEERRIEWVEALRALHKAHKLFDIKYSISQQEKYMPAFAVGLGGFALNRSVMKLELDMLHEGDLLQLAESLSASNTAPFILRDCEITRRDASGAFSKQLVANLHAQCELDWLTLREPAPIPAPSVP